MNFQPAAQQKTEISLPSVAALAVGAGQVALLSEDGELQTLPLAQAQMTLHKQTVLLCHAPYTRAKLGIDDLYAFDVLELFAFVHPVKFCVPTPKGLCAALGLDAPKNLEDVPFALVEIARALLTDLRSDPYKDADPLMIAELMGMRGRGWTWTPFIFSALGKSYDPEANVSDKSALGVFRKLPQWAEEAPAPPPAHNPVTGDEARARLAELLGPGAESRPEQVEYATQMTAAFAPVDEQGAPKIVLAEAGTGVGKTLGYIAPASVWAEKNKGAVWISTYTKNLQRQIEQELDRLYPDKKLKETHIAVRKGRENYLCLLNLADSLAAAGTARNISEAVAAGIMTRWAMATKDGDLSGGDFPGWLTGLLGFQRTAGLADRRGECIYSACEYYHRCFIERSVRKARHARLVIANHALVLIQTALADPEADLPRRYIFDEGHHLFSAADGAFAAHLSATETAELRRWILGNEGGRKSRARGMKRRLEDLIAGDGAAEKLLQDIAQAATSLTAPGWTTRIKDSNPQGAAEKFIALVHKQVLARAANNNGSYSLETETRPLIPGLADAALDLKDALVRLQKPMNAMAALLRKKLAEDEGQMDADTRRRIDAAASGIERRARMTLAAWIGMLDTLDRETPVEFVDWMEIEKSEGRTVDIGLYRHWVDPMKPFAAAILPHMQGMGVTSATLRDRSGSEGEDWRAARERTGINYLTQSAHEATVSSPFDYPQQTKVFIINDINKNDPAQVAGAYKTLFEASKGGALGLFTAIQRLRAVHRHIGERLEKNGITLYSQHIGEIDTGTLVDMFRDDVHACLLGTDAVRDGVDVPGESLRLIVFDRVPWPRPDILHKTRREAFGKRRYDEMITRLKLKQAFGRLIRRASDRGVFVMLDSALPSRLHGAFPEGVEIQKTGLADAAEQIRKFLVEE